MDSNNGRAIAFKIAGSVDVPSLVNINAAHSDNQELSVLFESHGSSILEGGAKTLTFEPVYDLSNKNSTGIPMSRAQFFTKEGFQFKNVSKVTVPESGS